jgi:hypothetical protein
MHTRLRSRAATPPLPMTHHARARAGERGIPYDEIDLVRRFGGAVHAAGRRRLSLDGIARPPGAPRWTWIRATSLVVIESADGWILTVYRQGLGHVRRAQGTMGKASRSGPPTLPAPRLPR